MSQSPVNGGFATPPASYPLGVSIADKVGVKRIDRRTADRMYQSHHSYLARGRKGYHYGVYLDGQLVGAITFDAWPSQSEIRGYKSREIKEVARVCIANDTSNLASCAMSIAQDTFVAERPDNDTAEDTPLSLLVTYVREDYEGSMFAALRGKGWERDGHSTGHAPGNRQKHEIHSWDKERWVCEL